MMPLFIIFTVMWLYLQYPAQLVVYGRPDNSAQLWPADDCLHTTIDRGNGEIIDNIIQQPATPTYQFIKYYSGVCVAVACPGTGLI